MVYFFQLLVNGLSTGASYAMIGVGFALIYSVLKFSNFSHGGTMVMCAYMAYIITTKITDSLLWTVVLSGLFGGLLNIAIEYICFHRLRKSNKMILLYFVSSVTMGMLLENIVSIKFSMTYYSYPNYFSKRFYTIGAFTLDLVDVIMLAVAACSIGILALILKKTRIGVSLRALSMDARTTGMMGVNVNLVVSFTFFIAGVFAAIAGIFVGMRTVLTPQLGSTYLIKGFIVSIIGGLGSLSGALAGALLLGILETLLTAWIGTGLTPVGVFIFTMLFLAVRPQGISGSLISEKA